MSQELSKQDDGNSLMNSIKDKIKNTILESIPEEQWDGLIKKEINAFFEEVTNVSIETTQTGGWGATKVEKLVFKGDEGMSVFRAMVWGECLDKTRTYFQTDIVNKYFTEGLIIEGDKGATRMDGLLQEMIPSAINSYFLNISRNMANTLRMDIEANMMSNGRY